MPTSLQMLLLLLLLCVSLAESAVLHPKLRRKNARKDSSSEEDDEETRTTTTKSSTKWYGADAEDIINQLEQIASDRQARVQIESNREDSFLNRLKALFTAPENVRPNGQLNDCFFTPMNCQLGGQKAAVHRKGHGVKVLVVRDEDLAKLVLRQQLAHGDMAKEEGGEKDLAKLDRRHTRRRKNGKF